jgi:hypothetical protein
MKKILSIVCLLLAFLSVHAQPAAGKLFVGGNVSLYLTKDKDKADGTTAENYSDFQYSLLPLAGYFLTDRIAVGARLGLTHDIYKEPQEPNRKESEIEFMIAPFGRYYIIAGTGGLFVEAFINTGIGKHKEYSDDVETADINLFSLDAGIAPGAYYYITPKLALEGKFGFFGVSTNMQKVDDNRSTNTTFGFDFSPVGFIFGLTYTL